MLPVSDRKTACLYAYENSGCHINWVFAECALMKKVSVWINDPLILFVYASIKKLLGDVLDNNKSR